MFLWSRGGKWPWRRFPRIRGDVPVVNNELFHLGEFSPHTRGCSGGEAVAYITAMVFPAYAGMFRCDTGDTSARSSFPRIRGDVPLKTLPGCTAS